MSTMEMPDILDDVMIFQGGLDLKTPTLKLKPGHWRDAKNWECVANKGGGGGYARCGGYERFNGRTSPSSGTYSVLVFSAFVDHPETWSGAPDLPESWETAIIKGQTSNAQAFVAFYVDESVTEFYNGEIYLVLTSSSGIFQVGETVVVRGYDIAGNENPPIATVGVITALDVATPHSPLVNAKFLNIAADRLRNDISAVPGSGPILGVVSMVFSGVRTVYAFRNNSGGTAAVMYRSSGAGWVAVTLYNEVYFESGGVVIPADGDTLTQGANSATIRRVVLESGEWEAGNAAGRLIVETPTPGNFSAGAATIGVVDLTLLGAQTAITLAPNGKYQFERFNFGGQLSTRKLYGASGVDRAFEFDGTTYVPIETKADADTPKWVRAHHFHLVLCIGSSMMISGPALPYKFTSSDGAIEVPVGDEITGMLVQPGNQDTASLAVFSRNSAGILYGKGVADWSFRWLNDAIGAIAYMQQNLDQSYRLDDQGVMSLAAGKEYGNFKQASLSAEIDTFLAEKRALAVGSCVSSDRSQLRLYFADGSALYTTIVNGKLVGHAPMLFPHPFSCVWSGEDASGNEETFAGAAQDGWVYQLDRGSSFDGEDIDHYMRFNWNFFGSPQIRKQFRNGRLEVQSNFYAAFSVGYSLSYGDESIFQATPVSYTSNFRGVPTWDNFFWDDFVWDGVTLSPSKIKIKGKAENIQMLITGSSDYVYPFTLSSLITHYNLTRRHR